MVLKELKTDYLDSVLFSLSSLSQWGRKSSIKMLRKFLNEGKTRFVSVTNFNLESLKEFKEEFGDKLFSHELHYSYEIRENYDLGITKYADDNHIKNIIFQPLRRNRTATRNWPLLIELSKKYNMTQNQIILNWMTSKGFIPLTKSETILHIDEYLDSLKFKVEDEDLRRIDEFRPPNWQTPTVDWYHSGDGMAIHQLPNIFDETLDKLK